MTCSTVGLVTQKKDGNWVAVLGDRILIILSLSFSPASDDYGSFFYAFGPCGGKLKLPHYAMEEICTVHFMKLNELKG